MSSWNVGVYRFDFDVEEAKNSVMDCKKAKAFTLIELLVVIAIIALLLAVLVPALRIAKQKAKSLVCRANLKSLQLTTSLYAQNNGDRMMTYMPDGTYGNLWIEGVASYCENIDEVRYCPNTKPIMEEGRSIGDAKTAWRWQNYTDPSGTIKAVNGSYAINGWFYHYSGDFYARYQSSLEPDFKEMIYETINSPKMPGLTPCFADAVWVDVWPVDTEICTDLLNLSDGPGTRMWGMGKFWNIEKLLTNRHGRVTNVSFIDGHQEEIALDMMWTLKWNAKFISRGKLTRQPSGNPVYP